MNFYVYIYLDPRKPGKYKYGKYEFNYEPFYIGKGKNKQCKRINGRTEYFKRIINKIRESELKPIIIKPKDSLNEENSFILESELIKLIGRKDLNKGPLINYTDGGEGMSGYICSEKTKKLMRLKMKGQNHPMFGKYHTEKWKNEQSEKMKGENNPMYGNHHSEETKKKQSEKKKKLFKLRKLNLKGENGPNSKLTENKVIQIRQYLKEGILTQKEIGQIFGVKQSIISLIKLEKVWKHVK